VRLFQPLHDGFNRGVPVGFVGGAQAVEFVDGLAGTPTLLRYLLRIAMSPSSCSMLLCCTFVSRSWTSSTLTLRFAGLPGVGLV